MPHTVAVIAPGSMGSAVGARLAGQGVIVLTSLAGRSAASAARADAAGMRPADDAEIGGADIVLSIVPPGEALALAQRLAPVLTAGTVYVDCNAVNPDTVARVAAAVAPSGARFVDGGIIGGPPRHGGKGPVFYVSGPEAAAALVLNEAGLDMRVTGEAVGAASALKMSYGGITKGLTAIATAMLLGATRRGAAPALHAELADSQAALLKRFTSGVPDMVPKAYRWVAEMEEIAGFVAASEGARMMFEGAARLYAEIAADAAGERTEVAALDAFLKA